MKNKAKKQYIKHIGGTYLNGRCAIKYNLGDLVHVSIENTSGKTIAFEIMTQDKYDELEEKWMSGCHGGDARIVQRALKHFDLWKE